MTPDLRSRNRHPGGRKRRPRRPSSRDCFRMQQSERSVCVESKGKKDAPLGWKAQLCLYRRKLDWWWMRTRVARRGRGRRCGNEHLPRRRELARDALFRAPHAQRPVVRAAGTRVAACAARGERALLLRLVLGEENGRILYDEASEQFGRRSPTVGRPRVRGRLTRDGPHTVEADPLAVRALWASFVALDSAPSAPVAARLGAAPLELLRAGLAAARLVLVQGFLASSRQILGRAQGRVDLRR